ncbi:MAG: Crp/Fnr family transcriptional regulator [Candidatus Marinimicrobia bacterium]|jgi:CRP-like cAMP-binding protein|nr:Crp/Fnr family transcriptional regulator [Candidatus Neomarinimicrobiota bacterium]MCK9483179.1 Crp/Fnr family transcriptional regulator [Candidatus Neomarinimicrobiota bacterium]MCK9558987.1 Crp/Fnr family transcriptional regulator [Candidatus Neomarinimicrobiota bacterium]MDD5061576.1 Crp/Fnr family transcriptional regulator [Candidatus Neomarinimicrobiota bacterium]MDD5231174.1 Crp/Fnr family transcriptional regulator [Candidatus Neomarinimicrobiota bacterium]
METQVLKNIPLFADLKDDIIQKIYNLMQKRIYKKGNIILMEEEFGDTLFILNKGSVKITRLSDDGREVILSILGEGDFFGEMSIFDGENRSANVVALEDTAVLILKRGDFLDLLEKHPRIAIVLLQEMAMRLRRSDQQIEGLSLSDAENRIAMSLLRLAEDLGIIKQGQVVIENLPYQQDIANMAGTSRETVSRMLTLLQRKGYVQKRGRRLIITNYDEFVKQFS